jgi:hypothetical protein
VSARGAVRAVPAALRASLPLALVVALVGCRERPAERASPPPAVVASSPPAAQVAAPDAALAVEPAVEQPERDPRAPRVRLRLAVGPGDAEVFWGGKKLGVTVNGVFEIERPRGSGPLDLMLRAPGFLPHHTRLYTDRDDKLAVRLTRHGEAAGLLGWKPAPDSPPPPPR